PHSVSACASDPTFRRSPNRFVRLLHTHRDSEPANQFQSRRGVIGPPSRGLLAHYPAATAALGGLDFAYSIGSSLAGHDGCTLTGGGQVAIIRSFEGATWHSVPRSKRYSR